MPSVWPNDLTLRGQRLAMGLMNVLPMYPSSGHAIIHELHNSLFNAGYDRFFCPSHNIDVPES
jgi:hypothetical protein